MTPPGTTPDSGSPQIKQTLKNMWMAGDFGKVAEMSAKEAERFVSRLNIPKGAKVLDVACGTGNLAIPAARDGAQVTGVDIATNLLEQARSRAAAENLQIKFDEGDAENLPYADNSFDVVMSMFGAIFAPNPEKTAQELVRACKPGGKIAMANWRPEGFVAHTFHVTSKHSPPPPGGVSALLWGDEKMVRERFGSSVSNVEMNRRNVEFRYPFSPKGVVQFFRQYFGPSVSAFARLDAKGQEALAADLEAAWSQFNRSQGDETVVPMDYLEVVATKA
jgi:ubiquinone/menaquinone biosynthesis C-methylase UbiE